MQANPSLPPFLESDDALQILRRPFQFLQAKSVSRFGKLKSGLVSCFVAVLAVIFYRSILALVLLAFGVLVGYWLAGSDSSESAFMLNVSRWAEFFNARVILANHALNSPRHPNKAELPGASVDLTARISLLLDLVNRDFILVWFTPLNVSKSFEFQDHLRYAMNAMIVNLVQYTKRLVSRQRNIELFTMLTYSSANSLIIHLREFSLFKSTGVSWKEYIQDQGETGYYNKASFTSKNQIARLGALSSLILQRILPKFESESVSLRLILTEILTTSILLPILDRFSQPTELTLLIRTFLETCKSASGGAAGLKISTAPLKAAEELGDIHDILANPDLFQLLMEYLESISAPPYLRFWTNAEFYKQFHSITSSSFNTPEAMGLDARSIFDSHFSANAELPIALFTSRTIAKELASMPLSEDEVGGIVESKNKQVIKELETKISHAPSVDCFDRCLVFVARILEAEYLQDFLKSDIYRLENEKPLPPRKNSTVSVSNTSQYESDMDLYSDNDPLGFGYQSNPTSIENLGQLSAQSSREEMFMRLEPATVDVSAGAPSDALQHIISSIINYREQLMLVNSNVSQLRLKLKNSGILSPAISDISKASELTAKLRRALKTRKEIEKEIERLMLMVSEHEKGDDSTALNAAPLDLTDLTVNVSLSRNEFAKISEMSPFSARPRIVSYAIEVEKRTATTAASAIGQNNWTFYRSYSDFQRLDEQLKSQFKKVAQIKLPVPKKKRSLLGQFVQQADTSSGEENICAELQAYLQMLLVDQLLYESKPMQLFFKPQDIAGRSKKNNATPDLRNKIFSLIKSVPLPNIPSLNSPKRRSGYGIDVGGALKFSDSPLKSPTMMTPVQTGDDGPTEEKEKPERPPEALDVDLFIDTFFALLTEVFSLDDLNHWIRRQALGIVRQLLLQQSKDKSGRVYSYFASNIRDTLQSSLEDMFQDQSICGMLDWVLLDAFWPPPARRWVFETDEYKKTLPLKPLDSQKLFEETKNLLVSLLNSHENGGSEDVGKDKKDALTVPLLQQQNYSDTSMNSPANSNTDLKSKVAAPSQQSSSANAEYFKLVQLYLFRMAGKKNTIDGCVRLLEMLQQLELNLVMWLNLLEVGVKLLFDADRRKY